MRYTEEQEKIIESVKNGVGVFSVTALAGTGKTTTCLETMKSLDKNKKILYVVFNKAMQQEATQRLGNGYPNIEIKTTHAFAYQYCKKAGIITGELNNIRAGHLKTIFAIDYRTAFILNELFRKFLYSSYTLSDDGIAEFVENYYEYSTANHFLSKELAIDYMQDIVKAVMNQTLPMPHDFYLKYFASNMASKVSKYDLIILDEAQDANPCTIQMLKNLQTDRLMLVGDPNQRIYAFRNSVMATKFFKDTKKLYLTHTFRFGEDISYYANSILKFVNSPVEIKAEKRNEARKREAIIARTNIELLELYQERKNDTKIMFERNISDIVKLPLTIALLYEGQTKEDLERELKNANQYLDPVILALFKDFNELSDYVKEKMTSKSANEDDIIDEQDLITAYKLITDEAITLYDIINIIKTYKHNTKPDNDALYLTTPHASKGSEYKKVVVKNSMHIATEMLEEYLKDDKIDNAKMKAKRKIKKEAIKSEINLLYVALTRASSKMIVENYIEKTIEDMIRLSNQRQNQKQNHPPKPMQKNIIKK